MDNNTDTAVNALNKKKPLLARRQLRRQLRQPKFEVDKMPLSMVILLTKKSSGRMLPFQL
jgi:hypothetical protein